MSLTSPSPIKKNELPVFPEGTPILEKYREIFSNHQAFKFNESDVQSEDMRVLLSEFRLENDLKQLEDMNSSKNQREHVNIDTVASLRQQRDQHLKLITKESILDHNHSFHEFNDTKNEPMNTFNSIRNILSSFFKSSVKNLKNKKNKIVSRCLLYQYEPNSIPIPIKNYFKKLNNLMEYCSQQYNELNSVKYEHNSECFQKNILLYIHSFIRIKHCRKKIDRLLSCINLLEIGRKEEILDFVRKIAEDHIETKMQSIPWIATDPRLISDELKVLKQSFRLSQDSSASDLFLASISKKFEGWFSRQNVLESLTPYRINKNQSPNSKIYLKYSSWNQVKRKVFIPFPTDQIRTYQETTLNNTKHDTILEIELGFLLYEDSSTALKRLKSLGESHFERTKNQLSNSFTRINSKKSYSLSSTISSVYILRYLKTREFRYKCFNILNYFRSIQEYIFQDIWKHSKHSDIVNNPLYEEISSYYGWYSLDNSSEHLSIMDRYTLDEDGNIEVRDQNGVQIFYNDTFDDMNKLENFLVKLGSHFINKIHEDNENVDRHSILQDLFESHMWFLDSKRKVINCLFEIHSHTIEHEKRRNLGVRILETIDIEPRIDLEKDYFMDSYSSEIVGLELKHSLLQETIAALISRERRISHDLENTIKNSDNLDSDSLPFDLPLDMDPIVESSPFIPGSNLVGISEFFESLYSSFEVLEAVEETAEKIRTAMGTNSSLISSKVERAVIQTAMVEWRNFNDQQHFHQEILQNLDSELRHPPPILSVHPACILEELDEKISHISSDEDPSSLIEGETSFTFTSDQIYANCFEFTIRYFELVQELFGKEMENLIYLKQKEGKEFEIVSERAEYFNDLTISEFEKDLGEFELTHSKGIASMVMGHSLDTFRKAHQIERMHSHVYWVLIHINNLILDEESNTSNQCLMAVNTVLKPLRDQVIQQYEAQSQEYLSKSDLPNNFEEDLKQIKINLIDDYCFQLRDTIKILNCRLKSSRSSKEIITYLEQEFQETSSFSISEGKDTIFDSKEEWQASKTNDSNDLFFLTRNGDVINIGRMCMPSDIGRFELSANENGEIIWGNLVLYLVHLHLLLATEIMTRRIKLNNTHNNLLKEKVNSLYDKSSLEDVVCHISGITRSAVLLILLSLYRTYRRINESEHPSKTQNIVKREIYYFTYHFFDTNSSIQEMKCVLWEPLTSSRQNAFLEYVGSCFLHLDSSTREILDHEYQEAEREFGYLEMNTQIDQIEKSILKIHVSLLIRKMNYNSKTRHLVSSEGETSNTSLSPSSLLSQYELILIQNDHLNMETKFFGKTPFLTDQRDIKEFQPMIQFKTKNDFMKMTSIGEEKGEIVIDEKELENFGNRLQTMISDWAKNEIEEDSSFLEEVKHVLNRKVLYLVDRKAAEMEHHVAINKRSMTRRIQSEVNERKYQLSMEVEQMRKTYYDLLERKDQASGSWEDSRIAADVRDEYNDRIKTLTRQLMLKKRKLSEYKSFLSREVHRNLSIVSGEAMLKMAKSNSAPEELKMKALNIAKSDSEMNRLKEDRDELFLTWSKLETWARLQESSLRARYIPKIKEAENALQETQLECNRSRERISEREENLRQQLITAEQSLRSTERELSQLKKDLALQQKNRHALKKWKKRNVGTLQRLTERVERYERWSQYDVDKLLLEIEKKDQQLNDLHNIENRMSRRSKLSQTKHKSSLSNIRRKLSRSSKLTSTAVHHIQSMSSPEANQKIAALKHLEKLKTCIRNAGLQVPQSFQAQTQLFKRSSSEMRHHSGHPRREMTKSAPPTKVHYKQ